jgi:pyridoxamine 5'-phosphate oxidase
MSLPTAPPASTEFDAPPADPISLFRAWFADAVEQGIREPGALALATADACGRTSNRIVQVLEIRNTGLVFTSHAGSRKGRDLAATAWASGVLYWRENSRQMIVTGPVDPLPAAESDALWAARPISMQPMSVASQQSAPLQDEGTLREAVLRLGRAGVPLARPASWLGYLLAPESVEFWQASPDRFHHRLRYEWSSHGWTTSRLQP